MLHPHGTVAQGAQGMAQVPLLLHPIPEASPELSWGSSAHSLHCAQETTLLLESSSHPYGLEVTFWGRSAAVLQQG